MPHSRLHSFMTALLLFVGSAEMALAQPTGPIGPPKGSTAPQVSDRIDEAQLEQALRTYDKSVRIREFRDEKTNALVHTMYALNLTIDGQQRGLVVLSYPNQGIALYEPLTRELSEEQSLEAVKRLKQASPELADHFFTLKKLDTFTVSAQMHLESSISRAAFEASLKEFLANVTKIQPILTDLR